MTARTHTSVAAAVPGVGSASIFLLGIGTASLLMMSGFMTALVIAPFLVTPVF